VKRFRIFLGVLVSLFILGLAFVSCDDDSTSGGGDDNGGSSYTVLSYWKGEANNGNDNVTLSLYSDDTFLFTIYYFKNQTFDRQESTSGIFTQNSNAITLKYYDYDGGGVFGTGTISNPSWTLNTSKYGNIPLQLQE